MGRFWMIGFWVFAGLCASCGWSMLKLPESDAAASESSDTSESTKTPVLWQRLSWVAVSALSSLMFIATTNHVCHDIATVPFLWIIPLALYLLTFIICFDHPRWYIRELWCGLCVASIFTLVCLDLDLGFVLNLALHFGTMFLICMVCHGELVKLRPENRNYITEYYLLDLSRWCVGRPIHYAHRERDTLTNTTSGRLDCSRVFAIAGGVLSLDRHSKEMARFGPASPWVFGIGVLVIATCAVAWSLDPI